MRRTILLLTSILLMFGVVFAQKQPQGDEYKAWMKDVQANVRAFNEAYNSMNMANAREAINNLFTLFSKVEEHWKKAQKSDAVGWAKDARERFQDAQDKMKRDDIAYALNLLQLAQRNCKSCHDQYRP